MGAGVSSPPLLGDDHLCSDTVEGLPQIGILQSHPDAALLVGLQWGGAGHTAAGFKVWGETNTHTHVLLVPSD